MEDRQYRMGEPSWIGMLKTYSRSIVVFAHKLETLREDAAYLDLKVCRRSIGSLGVSKVSFHVNSALEILGM